MNRYYGDPMAAPPLSLGAKFRKVEEGRYYLNDAGKRELHILIAEGGSDHDIINLIDEQGEWLP